MTDPTDADVRRAEDVVRGIVRTALDRHREDNYPGDTTGATDSVLAALEDELPDGFDALLEHAHHQLRRPAP